ncbi:MAG: DUF362 domain-containing protein [Clostridia bacterium]|nr:DUF362 domain-containing protein [Clostridia bacterium]
MEKTGIVCCDVYDQQKIDEAVQRLLALIGDQAEIVRGKKMLLKANLVDKARPDRMATTHPTVVAAVAKAFVSLGCEVTVGDSSGGPFTKAYMGSVYRACGMDEAVAYAGASLNEDFGYGEMVREENLARKKLEIIDAVRNADFVVNVTKFKSHCYTGYTGAVKNLFGTVPGLNKAQLHAEYPELAGFTDLLIDIERTLSEKVTLHIIDMVVCMEGAGPTSGTPKPVGALVASRCPYSADALALQLVSKGVEDMPLTARAIERGIFDGFWQSAVVGDAYNHLIVSDFDLTPPDTVMPLNKVVPKFLLPLFERWATKRPHIPKSKCKGCEKCKRHCPPEAIVMVKGKAVIDRKKCIKCYCCQELCPYHVVQVKKPWIYRLMRWLTGSGKGKKK